MSRSTAVSCIQGKLPQLVGQRGDFRIGGGGRHGELVAGQERKATARTAPWLQERCLHPLEGSNREESGGTTKIDLTVNKTDAQWC